ncbi:stimulator of interferon genes protein isoform X2 [Pseudomyrmex gracilis]|uniref:stimulator of interferon genes protein isoform X2 n=1 Tax=Pseudomyrmex gracilis TaxID=219809 RepID=UPI000995B46D|nr:stimulator of interferon genes protein isoform X2 [Pseudomyrmex gracilis]
MENERMTNLAKWQSCSLAAMKGLDYGTGMAYSYYYGYLRLVLPSTGTRDSKSINEKIENFEDNHNVNFTVHKLFILISSSGYIPPDLKEASQWMESASELEEETRNRAGNIGRKYRNNVYKIYPGGLKPGVKPYYVVAEGASPLLTFHEVIQHNHPESELFKRYKTEIIKTFYEKLQNILQSNPDTRDLCELIYYNDYDSSGVKVNVGELILERIYKLRSS